MLGIMLVIIGIITILIGIVTLGKIFISKYKFSVNSVGKITHIVNRNINNRKIAYAYYEYKIGSHKYRSNIDTRKINSIPNVGSTIKLKINKYKLSESKAFNFVNRHKIYAGTITTIAGTVIMCTGCAI